MKQPYQIKRQIPSVPIFLCYLQAVAFNIFLVTGYRVLTLVALFPLICN